PRVLGQGRRDGSPRRADRGAEGATAARLGRDQQRRFDPRAREVRLRPGRFADDRRRRAALRAQLAAYPEHVRAPAARIAVSLAAVAVVSGAIHGLNQIAPILSLGALYLFAVLPVAIFYGLAYAVGVSLVSMLAFNFFFLPPLHTLALRESENWVALAVFLVTAVVVSKLAIAAADAE